MTELRMKVLGISDGYLHTSNMQQASYGSGQDSGILRTRRLLSHIRLSVTLVDSYTWLASLVSLLRWNKEVYKLNKLFGIAQECLKGRDGLLFFAITLKNSIALLWQHTSWVFNNPAQIYPPKYTQPFTTSVTFILTQSAVMLSWGSCHCFLIACFVLVLAVLWSISKEWFLKIMSNDYIPLLEILHYPSPLNEIQVLYVDFLSNLTTSPTMFCYCLLTSH